MAQRGVWKGGDTKHPIRNTRRYKRAVETVRDRVRLHGERCHFEGRPGYEDCPGAIDLSLTPQDKWGFTSHHLDKLMHDDSQACNPDRMRGAHRSCNSRDGLKAQNARRRAKAEGTYRPSVRRVDAPEPVTQQPTEEWAEEDTSTVDEWQMNDYWIDNLQPDVTSRTWPTPSDSHTQ